MASRLFRRQPDGHTLQPTALVHEAYARMTGLNLEWTDRVHYLSMAARCMRRVLVDHARRKRADKRGGEAERVTLNDGVLKGGPADVDLLDLDRALDRLAAEHADAATSIELHYFGGLTQAEVGEATGVSESTALRNLRFARAWLRGALSDED